MGEGVSVDRRDDLKLNAGACRALPTEDGGVLVDLDRNAYYTLNHSGFAIWTSLSGGATREQASQALVAGYALTAEAARNAVSQFIEQLMQQNLVTGG